MNIAELIERSTSPIIDYNFSVIHTRVLLVGMQRQHVLAHLARERAPNTARRIVSQWQVLHSTLDTKLDVHARQSAVVELLATKHVSDISAAILDDARERVRRRHHHTIDSQVVLLVQQLHHAFAKRVQERNVKLSGRSTSSGRCCARSLRLDQDDG